MKRKGQKKKGNTSNQKLNGGGSGEGRECQEESLRNLLEHSVQGKIGETVDCNLDHRNTRELKTNVHLNSKIMKET